MAVDVQTELLYLLYLLYFLLLLHQVLRLTQLTTQVRRFVHMDSVALGHNVNLERLQDLRVFFKERRGNKTALTRDGDMQCVVERYRQNQKNALAQEIAATKLHPHIGVRTGR